MPENRWLRKKSICGVPCKYASLLRFYAPCIWSFLLGHPHFDFLRNHQNRLAEISVTESGIGINREDWERIFAPFEEVESSASRRYQGTGLGLALTEKMVELHGGKI